MANRNEEPTSAYAETRSVSVKLDGRASIEHQLDIHVLDLADAPEHAEISLGDVLQGLKYVMDYRIKGGKQPHLDGKLMEKLLDGLLANMAHQTGNLLKQYPTPEADLAFVLFGEFLQEVEEFRTAVGKKSATDLRHYLKFHRRCQPSSSEEERAAAAGVLSLLMAYCPHHDWKELVKEDEHDDVLKLMKEYKDVFSGIGSMPAATVVLPPQALYFDKNAERLAEMYGSNMQTGLASSRIGELAMHYGPNKLPSPPRESALAMFWAQLSDFMVLILIAAAVAQFATKDWEAGVVLMVVVVMNITIGFTQEYKANKALEALLSLSVPQATVIRDGQTQVIDSVGLVPGDIVVLEEGDAVPADLRLCEVAQLEIVEVILTGEALGIPKNTRTIRKRTRRLPLGDCKGNAFMTTVVARGRGKGIVVRTGNHTEIGKISSAITAAPKKQTGLQKKLARLGMWLVAASIFLCVLIIVIGVAYKRDTVETVKVGVSLAVSVIPEGLVAVVTITMALGVVRMSRHNAIVRKLPSVETLGSVDVICSDKTGTLTEGKMGTAELWTSDNSLFSFTHSTNMDPNVGNAQLLSTISLDEALAQAAQPQPAADRSTATDIGKSLEAVPKHLFAANMAFALCNNSNLTYVDEDKAWKSTGDPTEVAMTVAAYKVGFGREWFLNDIGMKKIGEYAFDSERKLMSVIFQQASNVSGTKKGFSPETTFIFAKGAPEGVLANSTHYLPPTPASEQGKNTFRFLEDVEPMPMTDQFVEVVSQQAQQMASGGLRVLALAMRRVSPGDAQSIIGAQVHTAAEQQLCFIGLIGLIDPPKEGVKESVATCKLAGVKVIMITGDHIATATAIAKQLGILDPNLPSMSRAMKGVEVDMLSQEHLAALNPFPVVFARVSPDNKLKIVTALQSRNFSVAMTGDGVNDAPAIKQADVGVAMGIGGTEITKQAADIVLADDNFSTIVEAVREGRGVFDNIQKFVIYLLSCNSAEIYLFLITSLCNLPAPFTTIQILWANIIADVPTSLSLGVEPHETDIMTRTPRPQGEGVLTMSTSLYVLAQGIVMAVLTFGAYLLGYYRHVGGDYLQEQRSVTFVTLTTMQLTYAFYSRSIRNSVFRTGIVGNRWLVAAWIGSMACMIMGVYVPGLNDWLNFVPIGGVGWAVVCVCVVVQFVLVETLKAANRRWGRGGYRRKNNRYNDLHSEMEVRL
ncbi:hypothetical protein BC832DRAFT_617978 [Gaertneriomyces semiglobifer]|nr:hypothetical protein BC832DRAFT_617978 [Gaertneriomyces semiglobifer]